jgi:predicted transcriptional regulator YheO
MNFKFVILILLFIGILCITINLTQSSYQCPTTKIIYKYVPRTFDEEQREPVYPSDIFKTMFSQQSPWIRSISDLDTQKQEVMNKYFVSQY